LSSAKLLEEDKFERHFINGYNEIKLVGIELREREDKELGVKWEWWLELEMDKICLG
jgi:hypothetical protein